MMAGFLYYLPKRSGTVSAAELRESALGYAFDGESATSCGVNGGPDGGQGLMVADDRRVPAGRVRYDAKDQRWQAMPWLIASKNDESEASVIAGPEAAPWVGYWQNDRPGPVDLQRADLLDGHRVTLGDGQDWLIPVARGSRDDDGELRWYVALPQSVGIDEAGQWVSGQVVQKYAALWEAACRWWDLFAGTVLADEERKDNRQVVELDFHGANDAALSALAANYVVGRAEVAVLDLLTDQNVQQVLNATIDWPTLSAWLEKKTTAQETAQPSAGSGSACAR